MKKLYLLLFLTFIGLSSFSQTQYEINEQASKDYKKADEKLNKTYKELIKVLETNSKHKDLLIKAQRAWITYRDTHCAYTESSYDGGSMQASVYFECMQQITEERIKELNDAIQERSGK